LRWIARIYYMRYTLITDYVCIFAAFSAVERRLPRYPVRSHLRVHPFITARYHSRSRFCFPGSAFSRLDIPGSPFAFTAVCGLLFFTRWIYTHVVRLRSRVPLHVTIFPRLPRAARVLRLTHTFCYRLVAAHLHSVSRFPTVRSAFVRVTLFYARTLHVVYPFTPVVANVHTCPTRFFWLVTFTFTLRCYLVDVTTVAVVTVHAQRCYRTPGCCLTVCGLFWLVPVTRIPFAFTFGCWIRTAFVAVPHYRFGCVLRAFCTLHVWLLPCILRGSALHYIPAAAFVIVTGHLFVDW